MDDYEKARRLMIKVQELARSVGDYEAGNMLANVLRSPPEDILKFAREIAARIQSADRSTR